LAAAVAADASLPVRFAVLCSGLDDAAVRSLCARIKVPTDCSEPALAFARLREQFQRAGRLDAVELAELVRAADGLRRPMLFRALIDVTQLVSRKAAESGDVDRARRRLQVALDAVCEIDAGAIARRAATPAAIQAALKVAREQAVARALDAMPG
jgi:tRNA nucleotidyltransferase (CCA-adding enzyme)